ncbi:hypothetical protein ACFCV3_40225 [Kribbella sp. NPDC056345]|uniref:hypothetical protein n=1 Tax=Kribbella sp. NPDC056345 TaxID=3345789 RepID=UPI0035D8AFA9
MTALMILLLVGATLGVVVLVLVTITLTKRRHAALWQRRHAMAQYGWHPAPPNPWLVEVAARLWARGRPHEMFAGDYRGRGMCVLEYMYTTSNGKTTTTHTVHLVALNLPVALPPLTLSAESAVTRMLAGPDLELESRLFNDQFRITCQDERYASAVLHPRMMEWMLHNPGLQWQLAGNALVSFAPGSFTVPDVAARLEAMTGVIDRIPSFVLRDYGAPV